MGWFYCFVGVYSDTFVKIKRMKKLALIASVVFTTLTLNSCREADEVFSPEETATLQRVQDSSDNVKAKNTENNISTEDNSSQTSNLEGEIVPPPKK